jgi:GNAT superfamily N-acetyltransferase
MNHILTDLSTPALTRAITGNLLAFFDWLQRAPSAEYYADEMIARWHTRIPHPWFSGVAARQLPTEDYRPVIEDSIAYFNARGVSPFTWWLSPAQPVDAWAQRLAPFGFHLDRGTPGMAVALHALPDRVIAPAGLIITPVEDDATLRTWTHTFIIGYELPHSWQPDFYELMAGLGLDWPLRSYLGHLDGEPVATATLFIGAGVAGVLNVSTVPPARGRGLGAALTLAPLLEARARGYRAGVLQSSEMGFNVYRRLGFEKLCDVAHFYCCPEREPD